MTLDQSAAALRAIRVLLEEHQDAARFRAAVRDLLRDLDTPPMFDVDDTAPKRVSLTDYRDDPTRPTLTAPGDIPRLFFEEPEKDRLF